MALLKTRLKKHLFNKTLAKKHLPTRTSEMNKIHGGKLLVIAGSRGMYGAGILSALTATRSGAGYTYLMMDWNHKDLLKHPDILFLKPDTKIVKTFKASAYIVGPGLGQAKKAQRILNIFIKDQKSPVLLDADGLNILAKKKNVRLPSNWVLTPHEGELARLLHVSAANIRKYPSRYLLEAHKKYGCVILLKGATTYVTDGKKLFICKTGTPALAKAGTGDVLSGIIGGLLAQNLEPVFAAALGAYVHGLASDLFLRAGNDILSLRPLDLIDYLPKSLKMIRR